MVEKTLKAFYVRDVQEFPPKTHKLENIAEKTQLKLSAEEIDFLKEINEFNLETRYPDKRFSFYQKCDYQFTKEYFEKIKEFYQCLLQKI